jgi:hypothetical protein
MVKVVDRGWDACISRQLGADNLASKAGYPTEGETYDDGLTTLQVAVFNEFGTKDIPMRAHVRAAYDEDVDNLARLSAVEYGKVVDGTQTAQQAIARLGEYHTGVIQKKIKEGPFKENAPATIAKKGSDRPLIDTGAMIQAVTHEEVVLA